MRRRIFLTLVLLIVAVGAIAAFLVTRSLRDAPLIVGDGAQVTDLQPGLPPRDLAVVGSVDGNWDILLLTATGDVNNLTPDPEDRTVYDYFASWSLDGQQINFLANRGSADELGPTQVNADGSGLRSLSVLQAVFSLAQEQRFDWDPVWSPPLEDGRLLAWSSLRDLNLELYRIPLDAEFEIANATRLTRSGARDWFAAWSPDGSHLAFASDRAGNEDVYLLDENAEEPRQLTDSPWDDIRPVWSADGETILFVRDEEDALLRGELLLFLMDADGSNQRPLADEVFTSGGIWSPDGAWQAIMSNAAGQWEVSVQSADSAQFFRVSPEEGDYLFPAWRP